MQNELHHSKPSRAKRVALLSTALAFAATATSPSPATASDGWIQVREGESIQSAIDVARPGSTIVVVGDHVENVWIGKDGITLTGKRHASLTLPSDPTSNPCNDEADAPTLICVSPAGSGAAANRHRLDDVRVRRLVLNNPEGDALRAEFTTGQFGRHRGMIDADLDEAVVHGVARAALVQEAVSPEAAVALDGTRGRLLALSVVRREPRSTAELCSLLRSGRAVADPTLTWIGDEHVAAADGNAPKSGASTALEVSLDAAWIAANRHAGIEISFKRYVAVSQSTRNAVLQVGDRLLLLDGKPVGRGQFMAEAGDPVSDSVFTVMRGERRLEVAASEIDQGQVSILEAARTDAVRPPMIVRTNTSGPSAGIVSALAYLDAITIGDLTGGLTVAGTGTITPHGYVGSVAGVAPKGQAAADARADVLFVHRDDVKEAEAAVGGRLAVVAITSLRDAVAWLSDNNATQIDPSRPR